MMRHTNNKRQHESTSSSTDEEDRHKKLKTTHRKLEKRRKRRHSTSSSSTSSSTDTSSSSSEKYVRKHKKSKKPKEKTTKLKKRIRKKKGHKEKKARKVDKTLKVNVGSVASKEKRPEKLETSMEEASSDIPIGLMDRSMTPMTKEQWEKQQSIVRRVYDETTGRYRLIKGDGEVIEEIVSRDRHKQINQQATRGDGEYFQANLKHLNIRK